MEAVTMEKTEVAKKPKSQTTEFQGFIRNVFRVLRSNPKVRIKMDALNILNGFIVKVLEQIKKTALEISNKVTLLDTHIIAAIDVIFAAELARAAKAEARSKVARFAVLMAANKPTGGERKKPESLRGRLEMQFPISRLHRWLAKPSRNGYANRTSVRASVALAAVADYICAEILDLAEQHMRYAKNPTQITIARNNVKSAIDTDEELYQLCQKLGIVIRGPSSEKGVETRFVPPHILRARAKRMKAKVEAEAAGKSESESEDE